MKKREQKKREVMEKEKAKKEIKKRKIGGSVRGVEETGVRSKRKTGTKHKRVAQKQ